jgi:hypothetical protein
MDMVDLNGLLDLDTSDGREFFSAIQGNLLNGHGRDHTAHISLTFAADSAAPEIERGSKTIAGERRRMVRDVSEPR